MQYSGEDRGTEEEVLQIAERVAGLIYRIEQLACYAHSSCQVGRSAVSFSYSLSTALPRLARATTKKEKRRAPNPHKEHSQLLVRRSFCLTLQLQKVVRTSKGTPRVSSPCRTSVRQKMVQFLASGCGVRGWLGSANGDRMRVAECLLPVRLRNIFCRREAHQAARCPYTCCFPCFFESVQLRLCAEEWGNGNFNFRLGSVLEYFKRLRPWYDASNRGNILLKPPHCLLSTGIVLHHRHVLSFYDCICAGSYV